MPDGDYTFKILARYPQYAYKFSKEKSISISGNEIIDLSNSKIDYSTIKTGDIVKFGSYEQDSNTKNGKEGIEWIVLSKNNKSLLLLSKYALDAAPYHKNENVKSITWEKCDLRKWLNNDFYNTAFYSSEKKLIKTTKLTNPDNKEYKTKGGKSTKDKVFVLSLDEIKNSQLGFNENIDAYDINRRCSGTVYATSYPSYIRYSRERNSITERGEGACDWWLRSPGDECFYEGIFGASAIDSTGRVSSAADGDDGYHGHEGYPISYTLGVRPAIYLNIE